MSKPGNNSIAYSGYLIPETGELIINKPGWFNYESVIQSIRDFLRIKPAPRGKKYCMILDNAPWHKKALRLIVDEKRPEYSDIRKYVEFLSLPPYSPDLNPIEQVWRKTRREKTHNQYFPTLSDIICILDEYFEGFFNPNDELRTLCSFDCFV